MKYSKLTRFLTVTIFTFFSIALMSQKVGANELKVTGNEKIIVYYFYGNMRCVTCKKIEELTKQAVINTFGDNNKNVIYKALNVEEDGNEHYIQDYQLMIKCVVIAKEKNGEESGWKRLDKVWNYYSDQDEFFDYFTDNAKTLLSQK